MAVGGRMDNNATGATWIFERASSGEWRQQGDKMVGTGGEGEQRQGVRFCIASAYARLLAYLSLLSAAW